MVADDFSVVVADDEEEDEAVVLSSSTFKFISNPPGSVLLASVSVDAEVAVEAEVVFEDDDGCGGGDVDAEDDVDEGDAVVEEAAAAIRDWIRRWLRTIEEACFVDVGGGGDEDTSGLYSVVVGVVDAE